MNLTEAIGTIRSNAFKLQLEEHIVELRAAQGTIQDRDNIQKQYKYLEFVTNTYPDAVAEYLSQEPEHFAGLSKQTTDAGMAHYVRQVADRIFNYSIVGKVVGGLIPRMFKPGEAGGESVIESLVKQAEQAEEKNHGKD